jgi:serine/threonine-protein kinase PpkA
VFLTRNQLSELALSLRRIIDQAKAANLDQASFFSLLRGLAATTSQDPNRNFRTIAESDLLPAYLKLLPYRSDMLQISQESWVNMAPTKREELIDRLVYKRRAYEDIYKDTNNWRDLGDSDPGQAVYPVSIDYLP